MKALTINPLTKKITEVDIEMKANAVYSFFNSILIDELSALQQHTIYADANALSELKTPYFIGEQLVLGDAFIVGLNGMEEVDALIDIATLETLITYEVNNFYRDALTLLAQSDINLYRNFEVLREEQQIQLNAEWVLYTFNMANEKTQDYFLVELQKAVDQKEDIALFIKKMAQLAINAAQ